MSNKLKALGLALVAALALTAVMASAASAQFTSSAEHTIISGSQTTSHQFTAGSGFAAISCTTASLSGTAIAKSESTTTWKVTKVGCKDSLGRTVDVIKNTLEFHALSGASKGLYTRTGELILTITGATHCVVTVKGHQTNNGFSFTNLGGSKGVEITTNTNNIASTVEGGFFACGTTTTSATGGTYTGKTVMTGVDTSGKAVEISVD